MFEALLESLLSRILGQYITGLNRNDLSVSMWSGDVRLHNVKLRNDIFQQFKLPLDLVFGQIGELQVSLPWSSIGSKPVDVLVGDMFIVVRK